jgi:hypothetical protein
LVQFLAINKTGAFPTLLRRAVMAKKEAALFREQPYFSVVTN